jgi:hypothetical protein
VARYLEGVPRDVVDKITHLNAMRLFSYDPFPLRSREKCTAGALREEAKGHDVSLVSKGLKKHETTVAVYDNDFVKVPSGA